MKLKLYCTMGDGAWALFSAKHTPDNLKISSGYGCDGVEIILSATDERRLYEFLKERNEDV